MSEIRVAAIVGGRGEKEAVPVLFRRIAGSIEPGLIVSVKPVLPVSESLMSKPGELERSIELAARGVGREGAIFILMDCDWLGICPKEDAPVWLDRARKARSDMEISLVFANKEYEAWFIAAAESLRGKRGLALDLTPDPHPETIRGAKEWLRDRMPQNRPYNPTIDQAALTAIFDLQTARRADSFDKCYREIVRLITTLKAKGN